MQRNKYKFSFTTFPDGKHFQLFIIFIALGLACVVIPFIFPITNQEKIFNTILSKVQEYRLTSPLQKGQFKLTKNPGDTKPSFGIL